MGKGEDVRPIELQVTWSSLHRAIHVEHNLEGRWAGVGPPGGEVGRKARRGERKQAREVDWFQILFFCREKKHR